MVQRAFAYCPVWVSISLVEQVKASQYLSKNNLSDYATAQSFAHLHRRLMPVVGWCGNVQFIHIAEDKLRRILGNALRESRYLDLCRNQAVHNARHPVDLRGSAMSHCVICAQGVDAHQPLPVKPGASGQAEEVLHPPDSSRCSKVCIQTCQPNTLVPLVTAPLQQSHASVCRSIWMPASSTNI